MASNFIQWILADDGVSMIEDPNGTLVNSEAEELSEYDRLVEQQDQELFHNGFVSKHTKQVFKKLI